MIRSLFSYFVAGATGFVVKTFYSAVEHVIHDIAQLKSYPVDQQTAGSDKMVCEITYN